jgi:membrane protease YdiL (CAAX protease family)
VLPRLRRIVASALAAALLHCALGPAFFEAAAQTVAARAAAGTAVPTAVLPPSVSLAAPSHAGLGLRPLAAPGLCALPSLSPLPTPRSSVVIETAPPVTAALARKGGSASAVHSRGTVARTVSAEQPEASPRLELDLSAETARETARPETPAERGAFLLARLFHGGRTRAGDPSAVAAPPQGKRRALLSAASDASAPKSDLAPPAPRGSISRAAKYGYVSAVLGLVVFVAVQAAAAAFGYTPHPNYSAPALPPAQMAYLVAFFAPVAEEIIFRAGLLHSVEWLLSRVSRRGAAVASAVLVSTAFALLHETSDPLLIAFRIADALLLSWVYKREGLFAAMVQHSVHNGLLVAAALSVKLVAAPWALPAQLGFLLLNLLAFAGAARGLWKQRADRREGRVGPYAMSALVLHLLGAALVAGSWLFAPSMFGIAAFIAANLIGYAYTRKETDEAFGRGRPLA